MTFNYRFINGQEMERKLDPESKHINYKYFLLFFLGRGNITGKGNLRGVREVEPINYHNGTKVRVGLQAVSDILGYGLMQVSNNVRSILLGAAIILYKAVCEITK